MNKNLTQIKVPFASGYALQNYSTAEQGIVDAAINGYQYWYIDGSLPSDLPSLWDQQRISNIIDLIQKFKISPLLHGNFKVPLSSDIDELRRAAVQYTKKEIDLASDLSAPLIIHGGAIVEPRLVNSVKKQALINFLDSVNELYDYAIKKNVTVLLENLSNYKNFRPFSYVFTHEEEFDFILSSTNVKFFLDLGHANIGNDSPKSIFEKYHSRIAGMSFSNNNGVQDQHLSLKKGTIDYEQIICSIQAIDWKGIIAFETRDNSPSSSILELVTIYNNVNACAIV